MAVESAFRSWPVGLPVQDRLGRGCRPRVRRSGVMAAVVARASPPDPGGRGVSRVLSHPCAAAPSGRARRAPSTPHGVAARPPCGAATESGTPARHVLGAAVAPSRPAAAGSRGPPDHSRPPPARHRGARDRAVAYARVDLAGVRARQPRDGLVGGRARCRVVPRSWRQLHRQLGGKPVVLPPSAAGRRHPAEIVDPRSGRGRAASWPRPQPQSRTCLPRRG